MNKFLKITLIIGIVLLSVGGIMCLGAMGSVGFDLGKVSPETFSATTHDITDEVTEINVNVIADNVNLLPSDDGKVSVVCYDSKNIKTKVGVSNGVLNISIDDKRPMFMRFIFGHHDIDIYLPSKLLESIKIESVSGDINIAKEITANKINLKNVSRDIISHATANSISIDSVSGDITANNIAGDKLDIKSVSGDIDINKAVINNAHITTTSGKISIDDFDALDTRIESISGDVHCRILSSKDFDINTVSGHIVKPSSSGKDAFYVKTTSGNVKIEII